jgi:NAD(P)-dependent dehydrogenase (short-subunit alcohol dehydrogenase family)
MTIPAPVALVTGSTSGIGQATALELAKQGFDILVHGLDAAGSERTVEQILKTGHSAHFIEADLRSPTAAQELVATAVAHYGRLNALVNNAGTGLTRRVEDISVDEWKQHLDLHVTSSFATCQAAAPHLSATKGAIVNVASLAALLALPGRVAYTAAKSAVVGMTKALACEFAAAGVRVNSVAPGTILTPLVERNFERGLLNGEEILKRTPLRRFGQPEEVAAVICFLLSSQASYITGQTIAVDGGWSVWGGWD